MIDPTLHGHVLRGMRKARDEAGETGRLNFEQTSYTDSQGKTQPMMPMPPPDPLAILPCDANGNALPGTVHRFPIDDIPAAIAAGWERLPVAGWLLWPSTAPLVLP